MSFKKNIINKFENLQLKIDKLRSKSNVKKSYKYTFLIVIIGIGYAFFLSSGMIFESENKVATTELNQKIIMKNSEIMILDETVNSENTLLEIKIRSEKTNINFANDYEVKAITKENTSENLPLEIIEVDENNLVILVTTPKKWSAIAVDIKEKNIKEQGEERLYIDKELCSKVDTLYKKVNEEYIIENIESDIKNIEVTIKKYEDEIQEKTLTINNIKSEISILESKKGYLTEKEMLDVNTKIESYKGNIISIEGNIKTLQGSINEEQEKIRMLNKKMNDIIKNLPKNLYDKYRS